MLEILFSLMADIFKIPANIGRHDSIQYNDNQHNDTRGFSFLLLCCVFYYAELRCTNCHSAKCHNAKCHSAKSHCTKCHSAKCHCAKCHSAKCHNAKCHGAKCHDAKCHCAKCYCAKCHSAKCPYVELYHTKYSQFLLK